MMTSSPSTQAIDKLFLELSQFTTATTRRELELHARVKELESDLSAINTRCETALGSSGVGNGTLIGIRNRCRSALGQPMPKAYRDPDEENHELREFITKALGIKGQAYLMSMDKGLTAEEDTQA